MNRPLRWAALLAAATFVLCIAACEADIQENCLGGVCVDPASETPPTGAGGALGAGGSSLFDCEFAEECVLDMPGPSMGILPCDVEAVLVDNCQRCHNPEGQVSSLPWMVYGDTQGLYGPRVKYAAMKDAIATNFMPFNSPPLVAEQRETILTWLCACARSAPSDTTCP